MLPQDPVILLSFINTRLRDTGCTLEEFCLEYGVRRDDITDRLAQIGFHYDAGLRRFR